MAEIVAPARPPALSFAIAVLALATLSASAAEARPRVSIQPIEGVGGAQVRATVVRVLKRKRLRVTTGIPRAEGTGQYYTWAREAGVKAFVAGELETRGQRQRATFLVWSGNSGSVVGRWTVVGRTGQLPLQVARGFWRHLGRAVARAQPPAQFREMAPGPTLRINAGSRFDGDVVGSLPAHAGRRPRR